MTNTSHSKRLAKLDGLFGHLSSCSGLYSKQTFLSLVSCITRMVRDHRMPGLVLTRTLGDDDFESITMALENRQGLNLIRLDGNDDIPSDAGIGPATGFVIVLTDRQCAALYWDVDARKSFQMYRGGWTFHPSDTKTLATHLAGHIDKHRNNDDLKSLIEETPVDRRYDDKMTTLVTSLVNGLESQSRDLSMALQQVQDLNKRMIEQESLAAIGQLCSVIAHEIRNPLGLIDLYAKLIETQIQQVVGPEETPEDAPEKLEKNITLIRQSIGSLETILSELTNYSRPLQLSTEAMNMVQMVQDVCDFYLPSYQEKGVTLTVEPPPRDEILLSIDTGRIRQALINLLKNALEVSSSGSQVTVTVASRQNDDKVYIKVQDQGPGVDDKFRQKLFTPYFSTKKNGTGLGLAHTRKILQAHGGSVELLASSSEGSTFALILPVQLQEGIEVSHHAQ